MTPNPPRAVAILAWHKIGPPPADGWPTWNYVPEATFLAQLQCLQQDGFRVVTLAALLQGLDHPEQLPPRAALLTFDDGYRSLRSVVAPLLQARGLPWTVFVPTDHVGGSNAFDQGAEPYEPICSWDDLRAIAACGASIASHGASHRTFSALEPEDLRAELTRSRASLQQELGQPVAALAFPFGDPGRDPERTDQLLAACGYRAALRYKGGGLVLPTAARFQLPRIAMGPDTDLAAELAALRAAVDRAPG